MRVRLASLVAAAAVLLSPLGTPVWAATLEGIQGDILVDRGGGFDLVSGPTPLNPGDAVIANPGSGAQVVYDDGCKVPVQPGSVVSVHKQSPCKKQVSEIASVGGGDEGIGTTTLVVGAAVVGLGVGAAVLLTAGDDDKPASP